MPPKPSRRRASRTRRPWDPAEDALLGTDTDTAIAERVGRSAMSVSARRRALGVAAHKRRGWTPEQDALLGTDSDGNIAVRVGKSPAACAQRRYALHIPAYRSPKNHIGATGDRATATAADADPWPKDQVDLLGVIADYQIAERTGRTIDAIAATRRALGRHSVDDLVRAIRRCDEPRRITDILCMWYGQMRQEVSVDTLMHACDLTRATAYRHIAVLREAAALLYPDDETPVDTGAQGNP